MFTVSISTLIIIALVGIIVGLIVGVTLTKPTFR